MAFSFRASAQRDLDPKRTMILRVFQLPGSPKLQGRTGKPPDGPALQWTGMPTTVRSHSKINLGLYIGAPRTDGFHSLTTVYQTLELHDFSHRDGPPRPDHIHQSHLQRLPRSHR